MRKTGIGNKEIRPLAAHQSYGQILAGLASPDGKTMLFLDNSTVPVLRCIDRMRNYFMSRLGIILIMETNAGDYIPCPRFINRGAGALDKHLIIVKEIYFVGNVFIMGGSEWEKFGMVGRDSLVIDIRLGFE